MLRLFSLMLICALLISCGGSSSSTSSGRGTTTTGSGGAGGGVGGEGGSGGSGGGSGGTGGGGGGGGGGTTTPAAPGVVSVSANQTTAGVDIAVVAPVGTNPNVLALGTIASPAVSGSATNTGGSIAQGSTVTVLMFGTGLSASMNISITGPSDLSVSDVKSIQSTDNPPVPGVSFTLAATPSAALGSRTVVLQDTSNNVTTLTGGLQVIP